MKNSIALFILLGCASTLHAQIIHIPIDQPTIQAGIDSASAGDTILVAEGTYLENINFRGKTITVASQFLLDGDTSHISKTIIDGSTPVHPDSGSTVTMLLATDTSSVLCGFTIQGGTGTAPFEFILGGATARRGAGIILAGGKISNNIIRDNKLDYSEVAYGGGICGGQVEHLNSDTYENIIIRGNIVYNNRVHSATHYASGAGIGVTFRGQYSIVENNIVYENTSTSDAPYKAMGGGMQLGRFNSCKGNAIVRNNYIHDNNIYSEISFGGGLFYILFYDTPANEFQPTRIYNNIIVNNHSNSHGGGTSFWYLGYWNSKPPLDPILINNTIIDNSAKNGSGLCVVDGKVGLINNIFWNEVPEPGGTELFDELFSYCAPKEPRWCMNNNRAKIHAAYNNIQGGWEGEGNIAFDPRFASDAFELSDSSLCIGSGVDSIKLEGIWHFTFKKDYHGNCRPDTSADHRVDMGAIESEYIKVFPELTMVSNSCLLQSDSLLVESDMDAVIYIVPDTTALLPDSIIKYQLASAETMAGSIAAIGLADIDFNDYQVCAVSHSGNACFKSLSFSLVRITPEITIRVNDYHTGEPIEDCELNIGEDQYITNAMGEFNITGCGDYNSYSISVSRINYYPEDTTLLVYSDTTIVLTLIKDSYLKVIDRLTKSPILRAFVEFEGKYVVTDENGIATIRNLRSEELVYSVEHNSYFSLEDTSTLISGDTLVVELSKLVAKIEFLVNDEWGPVADVSVDLSGRSKETSIDGTAYFLNLQARKTYYYILENACYTQVYDSLYLEIDTLIHTTLDRILILPVVDLGKSGDTLHISSSSPGDIHIVPPGIPGQADSIRANSMLKVQIYMDEPISLKIPELPEGEYWIYVIDECENVSEELTFYVGIEEQLAGNIKVYPNPVNGELIIELSYDGKYSLEITSVNGQIVQSKSFTGTIQRIDLSSFQKGIYYITIKSKDFVTTRKIIKM